MYRTLSAPVGVQWEVTPSCNHNCIWCYNHWRRGDPLPTLPPDHTSLFDKTVEELIRNKVMNTIITGGEPLLVFKHILPYIKRLSENGVQVYLNSNLTLMTPSIARQIKDAGVESILVSLPSSDQEMCDFLTTTPGSHEKIVKGIRVTQEASIPLVVNMVVCKLNLEHIYPTADFVASLGIKSFAASRAANPIPNSDFSRHILNTSEFQTMTQTLVDIKKRFGLRTSSLEVTPPCAFGDSLINYATRFCGAARNNCTIGHDGKVRPCNRLPLTYGSINDGLSTSWQAMREFRTDAFIPEKCNGCRYRLQCLGGCKADSLIESGKLDAPNNICDFSCEPKARKVILPLLDGDIFTPNPDLKTRQETFGFIVYTDPARWLVVTEPLKNLLEKGENVTIRDITIALCATTEAAKKTTALMVGNRILFPHKEG